MTRSHAFSERSVTFTPLSSLLAAPLDAVNTCLLEKMDSSVSLISEVASYLLALGGKRLRPLLTLASAELCGYKGQRHIHLAACIELIHTATLLHDDVVDESCLRRGMMSANAKWTDKTSVLVGDFLFSRAFELMVEDGSLEVLEILSKASSTLAAGEVMQLSFSHTLDLTHQGYMDIIEAKTACLFSAATHVGSVVAEASPQARKSLARFGRFLGLAFQVMDDLLDYTACENSLGKSIGGDFQSGKVTLPVILAYEKGIEPSFWEDSFENGKQSHNSFQKALQLLTSCGAFTDTRQVARNFVEEAVQSLKDFPQSDLKDAFCNLAFTSLNRKV